MKIANLTLAESTLATSTTSFPILPTNTTLEVEAAVNAILALSLSKPRSAFLTEHTALTNITLGGTPPKEAQRGVKFLVQGYRKLLVGDATYSVPYSFTISGANVAKTTAGTDIVSLAETDVATFVTACATLGMRVDMVRYRNYTLQ